MKVTVNLINGNYWYNPSFLNFSRRSWATRPYPSLQAMIEGEKLRDKNFVLSLNGDPDYKHFRLVCQLTKAPFSIRKADIVNLLAGAEPRDFKVEGTRANLRFDSKGVKLLKKGYLPFYGLDFYKEFSFSSSKNAGHLLVWRKHGWEELC